MSLIDINESAHELLTPLPDKTSGSGIPATILIDIYFLLETKEGEFNTLPENPLKLYRKQVLYSME
jgi:hypothetical protein